MKLDKKYFQLKSADVILLSQKYLVSGNPDEWAAKLDNVLKQIARDAAEAQREKCVELLSEVSFSTGRSEDFMKGFLMALVFTKGKMLNAALAIPDGE
jgi:hypothetical protein